jgi:hypothetical protein
MSKRVYKAVIEWEFTDADFEDEELRHMDESERIDYVKESIVEEVMSLDFGSSSDLHDAITVTIEEAT